MTQDGPQLPELDFLRPWRDKVPRSRFWSAVVGSLIYHGILLVLALFGPGSPLVRNAPVITVDLRKATPLYLPKELDVLILGGDTI